MLRKIFDIIALISIGYLVSYLLHKPTNSEILPPKIDTIQIIIRDSIDKVNDSITSEINSLEKEYNEKVDIITNSSDSMQLELFSRYIENYNRTNKDSQLNICRTRKVFFTDSVIRN